MKIYRLTIAYRIILILFLLILLYLGTTDLFSIEGDYRPKPPLGIYFDLIFLAGGILSLLTMKIVCDDEKIKSIVHLYFIKIEQTIQKKDLERIEIVYIMSSQFIFLNLFGNSNLVVALKKFIRNKIGIPIMFFPSALLGDILSKAPIGTKTYLQPELKEKFIERCGEEVIRRFDNIQIEPKTEKKKTSHLLRFLKGMLIVYLSSLIALTAYMYFKNHTIINLQMLPILLITAAFLSLTYFIYWRFFGGGKKTGKSV